jgi:hypothetical protein
VFVSAVSGVEVDMSWLGIAIALVIAVGVLVVMGKRPTRDLGAVSARWMAQHRDPP